MLQLCQTQFIHVHVNYEYHVTTLQKLVNLVTCILDLFVQPLVSVQLTSKLNSMYETKSHYSHVKVKLD